MENSFYIDKSTLSDFAFYLESPAFATKRFLPFKTATTAVHPESFPGL